MLYWINVDVINRTHSLLHFQQLSFKCLSNVYRVDIARQEARRSNRNWPITCVTRSWALKSVCLWQNCLGGTQIRSYPNSTKKESKNDTSRSNNNNTNKKESKHNKNNKNQTKNKKQEQESVLEHTIFSSVKFLRFLSIKTIASLPATSHGSRPRLLQSFIFLTTSRIARTAARRFDRRNLLRGESWNWKQLLPHAPQIHLGHRGLSIFPTSVVGRSRLLIQLKFCIGTICNMYDINIEDWNGLKKYVSISFHFHIMMVSWWYDEGINTFPIHVHGMYSCEGKMPPLYDLVVKDDDLRYRSALCGMTCFCAVGVGYGCSMASWIKLIYLYTWTYLWMLRVIHIFVKYI